MKTSHVLVASVAAFILSACFAAGTQCKQQMCVIVIILQYLF